MKNKQSGFTLIELLVVIIIIGILAGIILSVLNTARDNGGDAAIKANLEGVRKEASLFFNEKTLGDGSYRPALPNSSTAFTVCGSVAFDPAPPSRPTALGPGPNTPSNLSDLYKTRYLIQRAAEAAGVSMTAPVSATRCRLIGAGPASSNLIPETGGWIVGVALRSNPTGAFWCVDSSGNSKEVAGAIATTLTGNMAQCP